MKKKRNRQTNTKKKKKKEYFHRLLPHQSIYLHLCLYHISSALPSVTADTQTRYYCFHFQNFFWRQAINLGVFLFLLVSHFLHNLHKQILLVLPSLCIQNLITFHQWCFFYPGPSHHHFLPPPHLKYFHHSNRVVCHFSSRDLKLSVDHIVGARVYFIMYWEISPKAMEFWPLHLLIFQ